MPVRQSPASFTAGRAITIGGTAYAVGASIPAATVAALRNADGLIARRFIIPSTDTYASKATPALTTGFGSVRSHPMALNPFEGVVQQGLATVPGTPTATAGTKSATVTWTAPSNLGKGEQTGYLVVSSPGNFSKQVGPGVLTATVTGLTTSTSYTFTVTPTARHGNGTTSPASNSVTAL
jgi:hypothetical protein